MKMVAKSISEKETKKLKLEISLIKGFTEAYDTEGESLQDYINRFIIQNSLGVY